MNLNMTDGENPKNMSKDAKLDNDYENTEYNTTRIRTNGNDLDLNVKILENQIVEKQLEFEGKKQKTHNKLPNEFEVAGSSQESDKVGDNLTKKKPNILCECQPNVTGAAVPTVCSFHTSSSIRKLDNSNSNVALANDTQTILNSGQNNALEISLPHSQNSEQLVIHDETSEPSIFKSCADFTSSNFKNDIVTSVKQTNDRCNELSESLSTAFTIPKETINGMSSQDANTFEVENSFNTKSLENFNNCTEKNTIISKKTTKVKQQTFKSKDGNISPDAISNFNEKTGNETDITKLKKEYETKSLEIVNDRAEKNANADHHHSKNYSEKIRAVKQLAFKSKDGRLSNVNKTCLKKPSLIPKLAKPIAKLCCEKTEIENKTTINKLIEKFSDRRRSNATNEKTKKISSYQNIYHKSPCTSSISQENISTSKNHKSEKIGSHVEWLYSKIFEMKRLVMGLSKRPTWKQQLEYTDKLMENINELKQIADELEALKEEKKLQNMSTQSTELIEQQYIKRTSKTETSKSKDNKVYIKFMQSKTKSEKNLKDASNNLIEDKLLQQEVNVEDMNNNISKVKEIDSLDGVFIPSLEPPLHLEEDEETSGLDITITFPEFIESHDKGSQLSVRLSDISADALRKLKRCPKDFTLRMDFVQGKVHFQTGKAPANNFSIGPNLKFIENAMDDKKSDIIDIKPSTECKFGSEVISVENFKDMSSFKSLKSTDSELFNVVSLPFAYRALPLNAVTKSCYAFKTENIISAYLARQFVKSMPQIPSLTNILEDRVMDSIYKSALSPSEKRRKSRPMPKKPKTSNTTD